MAVVLVLVGASSTDVETEAIRLRTALGGQGVLVSDSTEGDRREIQRHGVSARDAMKTADLHYGKYPSPHVYLVRVTDPYVRKSGRGEPLLLNGRAVYVVELSGFTIPLHAGATGNSRYVFVDPFENRFLVATVR